MHTMRHVTRRLGMLLIVAALVGAVTVWQAGQSQAQQPDPQLVQQGNALYGNHCSLCHGATGLGNGQEGDEDYGPPLVNVGAASVDFMIASGRMPASDGRAPLERREPEFTGTEREALVAYVTSLEVPESMTEEELQEREISAEPGPGIPHLDPLDEADLGEGRALFTTHCAACHGPTAAGIAVGQDDVSSNLDGVPPLQVAEAIRSGPGVMPVFGDDILDDEQLTAVVAWVEALPERDSPGGVAIGRGGPVPEGMLAWVVGMGLLGIAVYLLGERIGTTMPVAVTAGNDDASAVAGDDHGADR